MNHVTKQGFYKMLCEENSVFGEVSVLLELTQFQFQFQSHCHSSGWGGRLIELGANSRLGAYSNKYGMQVSVHKMEQTRRHVREV